MRLRDRIGWLYRRWFGRYVIDDPRPIADEAPYTYFLPSENELLALAPGDSAKINFRSIPPGRIWEAERMWVAITAAQNDALTGTLDNDPSDMPQLRYGDTIAFRRSDVIDLMWSDNRTVAPPTGPERREYWDRCLVDDCVLTGDVKVHYLYREEPDPERADDRFPDSGWRIRGDYRSLSDEEIDNRETRYIALGKVLNEDDSWLHLIDAPVGSAFVRNWQTGAFEPEEN